MRCLFTMFAEDVGLIRKDAFKTLLRDCRDDSGSFLPLVSELWQAMDKGEYSTSVRERMKRFNGKLYEDAKVYPLGREEIGELLAAAEHDWKEVEPAIFGTLLEQALDVQERARLGAHYTPRAYVERLVVETVISPLREDWRAVLGAAEQLRDGGEAKRALALVEGFHAGLCRTRVLDPACGTGNFLHVAQELMKKLEGEVLEAAGELGSAERLGGFAEHAVGPHQFLGMETNRRAVAIADLVLWIGHLQWHFRTRGYAPREPILEKLDHIHKRDAVLAWDGWPIPQWRDGGEALPNPRRPDWPEAEFIVGNPPFIGGKDLRARLGDVYAQALWAAHPQMNESADLVMYWWDRAAELLTRPGTKLRRFGFVTTNSITQLFQRRTVERHLTGRRPVSLLMAIPDHPWTKAGKDTAAVRIAMTVAAAGTHEGKLCEVVSEAGLDSDQPEIVLSETRGRINSDLTVGTDVTQTAALRASAGLCSPGVKLHGSGFIISPRQAEALGLGKRPGLEGHVRPYRNGRDLTARPRDVMIIDLFGLSAEEVRERFPEIYQHVKLTVKEEKDGQGRVIGRDANRRDNYRQSWWLFGEPRRELRPALAPLQRYIATVETTKHRVFQFLDAAILPDNMLVAVGLSDAFHLGVLSSRFHVTWCLAQGGTLEDRPRYSKSRCFDPYPFPDASEAQKEAIRRPAEALGRLAQAGAGRASRADADEALQCPRGDPGRACADAGRGEHPRPRAGADPQRASRRHRCRGRGRLWLALRSRGAGHSRPPRRAEPRTQGGGKPRRDPLAQARLSAPALCPGRSGRRADRSRRTHRAGACPIRQGELPGRAGRARRRGAGRARGGAGRARRRRDRIALQARPPGRARRARHPRLARQGRRDRDRRRRPQFCPAPHGDGIARVSNGLFPPLRAQRSNRSSAGCCRPWIASSLRSSQ